MKALCCALALALAPMAAPALSERDYVMRLAPHVRSHWVPPRNLRSDEICALSLEITATGSVENLDHSRCSQRGGLKASALRAISRSTPMPLPLPDTGLDSGKLKAIIVLRR